MLGFDDENNQLDGWLYLVGLQLIMVPHIVPQIYTPTMFSKKPCNHSPKTIIKTLLHKAFTVLILLIIQEKSGGAQVSATVELDKLRRRFLQTLSNLLGLLVGNKGIYSIGVIFGLYSLIQYNKSKSKPYKKLLTNRPPHVFQDKFRNGTRGTLS